MNIFMDMDQVLCDWVEGACALFGLSIDECRKAGERDFVDFVRIRKEELWDRIRCEGPDFWVRLNPTEAFNQLKNFMVSRRDKGDKVSILSSPGEAGLYAHQGKATWLSYWKLAQFPLILCPSHEKCRWADKNSILIDDSRDNCTQWTVAGGLAFQWPSPYECAWLGGEMVSPERAERFLLGVERRIDEYLGH